MDELTQSAFLLHSRPYREHQQLLDFFTEHDGRVAAITYIGKSKKSNKKALLQAFSPLKIELYGQGSLKKLRQVEAGGKSYLLTNNHLYSAFYLNELLVRLLGEQISCQTLFEQYHQSLITLSKQQPIEIILRNFELALLDELGLSFDFSPVFDLNTSHFYYVVEQGFVPASSKLALPCYQAKHLQLIAQQVLSSPEVLHCFKVLMRQVLHHALGGKPLHSRKLFTQS